MGGGFWPQRMCRAALRFTSPCLLAKQCLALACPLERSLDRREFVSASPEMMLSRAGAQSRPRLGSIRRAVENPPANGAALASVEALGAANVNAGPINTAYGQAASMSLRLPVCRERVCCGR